MTSLYTKKDLEREYRLADTTVYRTLQACGLSTRQRTYTKDEIKRFEVARTLFQSGYTVAEVKTYFELKASYHANEKGTSSTV